MKHMPVLQLQEEEENFQVPVLAKSDTQSSQQDRKSNDGLKKDRILDDESQKSKK